MVLMNLMLAVVVEKASEAHSLTVEEEAEQHQNKRKQAFADLLKLCEALDEDKSGKLTAQELNWGFDNSPAFAAMMEVMDIGKQDMEVVFAIMDNDGSGDVDFQEFVTELYKMNSGDSHTMLVFIKFYVTEIRQKLVQQIEVLESTLGRKIDCLMKSMPTFGNATVEDGGSATSTVDLGKLSSVHEQLLLVLQDVSSKGESQTKLLQTIASVLRPQVPFLLPAPSQPSPRDFCKDGDVSSFAPHFPQLQSGHDMQHHLLQDIKQNQSHWSERKRQGSREQQRQQQSPNARREPVDDHSKCLTASCCSIHRSADSTSSPRFADGPIPGLPPPPRR
jgi:hypothetical protein